MDGYEIDYVLTVGFGVGDQVIFSGVDIDVDEGGAWKLSPQ